MRYRRIGTSEAASANLALLILRFTLALTCDTFLKRPSIAKCLDSERFPHAHATWTELRFLTMVQVAQVRTPNNPTSVAAVVKLTELEVIDGPSACS